MKATLTVAALAIATAGTASAQISLTLSGTLANSDGGPDPFGLDGASFTYQIDFADGATWGANGSNLSLTTASSSMTITGATDPSVNGTALQGFFGPLEYFYFPGSTSAFSDDASGPSFTAAYLLTGGQTGSDVFMDTLLRLLAPADMPTAGDLLTVDHFGAYDSDRTLLESRQGFGSSAGATLTEYALVDPTLTVVPAPASAAMLGLGGFAAVRRCRNGANFLTHIR